MNFELKNEEKEFSSFNIYFTYDSINSFVNEARLNGELKFYDIPLSGKTFLTVVGENKKGVFYDKIELKEGMNNTTIQLNMKKTNTEKLKKMFKAL